MLNLRMNRGFSRCAPHRIQKTLDCILRVASCLRLTKVNGANPLPLPIARKQRITSDNIRPADQRPALYGDRSWE